MAMDRQRSVAMAEIISNVLRQRALRQRTGGRRQRWGECLAATNSSSEFVLQVVAIDVLIGVSISRARLLQVALKLSCTFSIQ